MSNKNSLAVQIHDYSKGLDLNTTICWVRLLLDYKLTNGYGHVEKLRASIIQRCDAKFRW